MKIRRLFDVSVSSKSFLARFSVILIFGYYKSLIAAKLFPAELTLKFEISLIGFFGRMSADV